jgi:hypothetical protein
LAVLGVVLTHWDDNFSSVIASITYDHFTPTVKLNSYIPTWQEFALGTGIISYWLLGFSLAAPSYLSVTSVLVIIILRHNY